MKPNTWKNFICEPHEKITQKNNKQKTYERHSDMNPKNLTASFAGVTAQSWRNPRGPSPDFSLLLCRMKPAIGFFVLALKR